MIGINNKDYFQWKKIENRLNDTIIIIYGLGGSAECNAFHGIRKREDH
jgi:hypothetical protein